MRRVIFSWIIAAMLGTNPVIAQDMFVEQEVSRWGGDYSSFPVERGGAAACGAECARDPNCLAWTYARPGSEAAHGVCHLKATVPFGYSNPCCDSGVMVGTGEETRPRSAGASRAPVSRTPVSQAPVNQAEESESASLVSLARRQ